MPCPAPGRPGRPGPPVPDGAGGPGSGSGLAHPARMYDYYLGGTSNFAADREAAEQVLRALPEARDMAVANRAFLGRVVRFLAAAGVRQFLDVGTGIPGPGGTGEVLAACAPGSRVAYVDNDPLVTAHARGLFSGQDGSCVIEADVRDPAGILADPGLSGLFDLGQPVAVLLVAVLHFIRDDPAPVVARFRQALAPGSYLVISHGTADFDPVRSAEAVRFYERASAPFVLRSRAEIATWFGGLDLVEPGLVHLPAWRPERGPAPDPARVWLYAGAARKP